MTLKFRSALCGLGASLFVAVCAMPVAAQTRPAPAKLYELRTYSAAPGRVKDVEAEFQSWIIPGLARVGVHPIAYWSNDTDKPGVTYLMVFNDQAERDAAWARFRADPETEKARAAATAGYADGARAMTGADIRLMTMTPFSPHPKTAEGATLE
jgi:hypothetical protein